MNRVATLCAIGLAAATVPASAQMGGGMMPSGGGGAAPSRFEDLSMTMSATQKRDWAACQTKTPDDMVKDKRCVQLKKKVDHIAGKS